MTTLKKTVLLWPRDSSRTAIRVGLTFVVATAAASAAGGCSGSSQSGSPPIAGTNGSSQTTTGADGSSQTTTGTDGSSQTTDDGSDGGTSSSTNDAAGAHAGDGGSDATTPATGGDAPAGQSGANAYCAAVCDREATCLNVAIDASTCHCSAGTLTLYRSDYVTSLAACESAASCQDLLATDGSAADSGLETCADAALAQITPTAAVTSLCEQLGLSSCQEDAVPDCPGTFKVYSDGTVNAVSTCIADPNCNDHAACVTTALTP
jgi:hypothetical protein